MSEKAIRILFTSVGNLAFPSILADTGMAGLSLEIYGTDMREDAHGLYFCDEGFVVPSRSSSDFQDKLDTIIRDKKIQIIWPLSTEDQEYFGVRTEYYHAMGIKVICSKIEAVEVCNDKYKLYSTLQKENIPVPEYMYPIGDISPEAFKELGERIVLKSRKGTGGVHTYLLGTEGKNIQNGIDNQFLNSYENIQKIVNDEGPDLLATEYLPGKEYSVDSLSKNGVFIYGVVRERTTTKGGLAMVCETVNESEIIKLTEQIISILGLSFINNLQFRIGADGVPKIIDINPRIPGTIQLTLESGLPMISDVLAMIEGREIPRKNPTIGVKLIRYFHGIVVQPGKLKITNLK